MGEKKNQKIISYFITLALTFVSFQVFGYVDGNLISSENILRGSLAFWEDDFFNESKIDTDLSYGYVLNV